MLFVAIEQTASILESVKVGGASGAGPHVPHFGWSLFQYATGLSLLGLAPKNEM
jgi:hypothetical protein